MRCLDASAAPGVRGPVLREHDLARTASLDDVCARVLRAADENLVELGAAHLIGERER